jgi:WD40 repeat protein
VLDVALSQDGVLGASCSDDFSVRVWDLEHRECLKTCKGHTGWVVSVQFVGASHMVLSGSHDGTARVWDPWSGDCAAVLEGHSGRLNAVITSSDGTTIITCSDDNTARVWDGTSYKLIRFVLASAGLACSAAALPAAQHALAVVLLGVLLEPACSCNPKLIIILNFVHSCSAACWRVTPAG